MKGKIYPTKYGWQVRYGASICRHFQANNRLGAERFLNHLRHQEDQGQFDPRDYQVKDNPLSFTKLGEKWLLVKKKILRPRSFTNLERYMGRACEAWGHTNVKLIQYAQIEDFILDYPVGSKTRANIKSCLHDFFKWVKKRERIPMPDFPDTPFELEWRNVVDTKTQLDIITKIKELSYNRNPKIWFAAHCLATYIAVRPGELISLKEGQINLGMAALFFPHPKERQPKIVYLLDEDIEFIKSQPRGLPSMYFFRHPPGLKGATAGQRFGNRYLYKWWKKACTELGIDGVDLYGGTRHSTATALGRICTPEEVKDATGHASKAFERYFQSKQARALKVTQKIKEMRTNQSLINLSDAKEKRNTL
ncbi:hypothetical protein GWN26_09130 [Candidatus Saccharibacteria bacterium]|nr:hypothetical protein [Candidatus Saccharibacteria bacterium]NIS52962.1 hypothetical protein [Phycisphaerae bacterium]NIV03940.1 hypothetical protein [Calditrichia bacterium]NIV72299.1 hypothetical protein [Calditrichia bacterium]NIV99282.1 hypothetical protein [Candidatus Saccharibacteria bacterium]